eukprot:gene11633-13045_t
MSSPSLPVPFFICGKRFFRVFGVATMACGVAITVAGGMAAHNSSGYYLGGLYSGIASIIYSTTLFQVDTVYRGFWSMLIFALVNFIICVVALGISGSDLDFLNSLEACGSYGSSFVTTCSAIPTYVDCSGNSDYFTEAYSCELSYANDNDGTVDDNQCGCVTSDDDDTCYNYYHMRSCSSLLDDVPPEVSAAVTFLSILLVVSLITIVFVIINRLKPELIRSADEKRVMEELLQPINVNNVPVTSPLAATVVTPGVVVAVSTAPTAVVPVTPTIVSVTSPAPAPAPAPTPGTVVSVQAAPVVQPSNQV